VGLQSCKDVDSSGNVLHSDCVAKVDMCGLMLTEKRKFQAFLAILQTVLSMHWVMCGI
jgi:hypothetical protein